MKLSGSIPGPKLLEFEQTYRFAFTQIPRSCVHFVLEEDVLKSGVFCFNSIWTSFEALQDFRRSSPFVMMVGAFCALGKLDSNVYGDLIELEIGAQYSTNIKNESARISN